jgi:excinuclease ABC subunit C
LYLLQRIRDEAHRFAVTYHRKALVEYFRSMAKLKNATVEELAAIQGISRTVAEAEYEHFQ